MTLNLNKSRVLRGLIGDEKCLFACPLITDNTAYNELVDEVETWQAAYDTESLYLTAENNTVYLLEGIDQFPVPQKR